MSKFQRVDFVLFYFQFSNLGLGFSDTHYYTIMWHNEK